MVRAAARDPRTGQIGEITVLRDLVRVAAADDLQQLPGADDRTGRTGKGVDDRGAGHQGHSPSTRVSMSAGSIWSVSRLVRAVASATSVRSSIDVIPVRASPSRARALSSCALIRAPFLPSRQRRRRTMMGGAL